VLVWTKRTILAGKGQPFAEGLRAAEIMYLDGVMKTQDAKEGIGAFMEKRKAVWKDK
jgi:cyclohexa-1,5-dienecarbonyl-CoA hydratase